MTPPRSAKARTKPKHPRKTRKPSRLEHADIAVAETIEPARHSKPVRFLGWASELADQPPLMTLCGATLAVGLIAGNKRLAHAGARMLAAEILATKLKSLIKHRIDRTRPAVLAEGRAYRAERGASHASEMNSFPSGHTAGAVAVARAFTRGYPEHGKAAYSMAAAIGGIQIPRSKHFVSDVGAGALVGLAAAQIIDTAERVWQAFAAQGRDHAHNRMVTPANALNVLTIMEWEQK
jgi:membrane-associated phospholipid phosphatase